MYKGQAFGGGNPNGFSLAHQLAHGQHQPIANQHTAAFAFRAKHPGRKGIGRDLAAQAHHGAIGLSQIEAMLRRVGLQRFADVPFLCRLVVSVYWTSLLISRLRNTLGVRNWPKL